MQRMQDDTDRSTAPPLLVLVHGSLHSSFCWARVTPHLVEAGLRVLAIDLPGSGLNRPVFPASAYARPFDPVAYTAEATAAAAITLSDYKQAVGDLVDRLHAAGQGPIILVGHSLGGLTLNAVGESHCAKLAGLIYLAAVMPASNQSLMGWVIPILAAAGSYAALGNVGAVAADPVAVGVARFDLHTPDPVVRAKVKAAYCADVSEQDFQAWLNLLVPDDALAPYVEPIALTPERWGTLPRSYIHCTQDNVVPVAAAAAMVSAVDAWVPANPTVVRALAASHSPFLSKPQELAALIAELATR